MTSQPRPWDITVGTDGNLWFPEAGIAQIGRITPLGTVTEFNNLVFGPGLSGIAASSGGNIWFTEGSADQIGWITPAGDVTEFHGITVPAGFVGFATPTYIVSGPDGNIWFTELEANRIGRLNIRIFADGFERP